MDQQLGAARGLDHRRAGPGIARQHQPGLRGLEGKAEGVAHRPVVDLESLGAQLAERQYLTGAGAGADFGHLDLQRRGGGAPLVGHALLQFGAPQRHQAVHIGARAGRA